MVNHRQSFLLKLITGLWLLLLAGCRQHLTNLTPESMTRNPSHLYRLSVSCDIPESKAMAGTFKPEVVIDGTTLPLERDPKKDGVYYCDYRMGPNRVYAKYYFQLKYQSQSSSGNTIRNFFQQTDPYALKISNLGNITLEANRAPIGKTIRILGSGFTVNDHVLIERYEVPTTLQSETAITFEVPALIRGNEYPVYVVRGRETIFVGNLLIDSNSLQVQPKQLILAQGEKASLTVKLDAPALTTTPIHITTDVPKGLIVPECKIAAGQESASIPIEGSEPTKGNLYVSAIGYEEKTIPFEVTPFLGNPDVKWADTPVVEQPNFFSNPAPNR